MIYLGWFKRTKKKAKRYAKWNVTGQYYRSGYRMNKKYKGVGLTPDYALSPIDAVPYVGAAKKAGKVRKYRKRAVRGVKGAYKYSKRKPSRRTSSPNRRSSQSRRGGSSRYYYYRGKRYERKYKR